ncbi:MAG: DUF1566 domain-containing protein [Spirochaetaceae bacterium]|jgi:hypothetical protein|nr:DUF1566 domain-containing protein [Spirochaetaceae bacterium]
MKKIIVAFGLVFIIGIAGSAQSKIVDTHVKTVIGEIALYAGQAGKAYVDGEYVGELRANSTMKVRVNTAGTYTVSMQFVDGYHETVKVDLQVDGVVSAGFGYMIGDFGPAGGRIFYVKTEYSGGWRYLECAPTDAGTAEWGSIVLNGTGNLLGTGKANTALLISGLRQSGIRSGTAAHLCTAYSNAGFTDWFLPSKDELSYVYTNLKVRGYTLGFTNNYYWSSTQGNNNNQSWYQGFSDGYQSTYYGEKNRVYSVRPIRSF